MREFSAFLSYLIPGILVLGTFIGFYNYKRLDPMHKSIAVYLSLMLLMEISSRLLAQMGNNFIILHIISLLELLFFISFYKKYLLRKYQKLFIWLGIAGVMYIMGEILFYFVLNDITAKQYQPYSKVVDNFIVILMALAFFLEKIDTYKEAKWENFRLNAILLVFFTINLIVFLPFNFLVNESTGLKFYFWLVNIVILILLDVYLTYSVWKNARIEKHSPQKSFVN